MPYYNLAIVTSKELDIQLVHALKEAYNILLVDKKEHFRNIIEAENGYIIILRDKNRNMEILAKKFIDID